MKERSSISCTVVVAGALAAFFGTGCDATKAARRADASGAAGSSGSAAGTSGGSGVGGGSGAVGGATGFIDNTGGEPTPGGREGCASASIQSDFLSANVLFLVDRSGSMNCNLPPLQSSDDCEKSPKALDPSQPTKWGIITEALEGALAQLPAGAWAGINYFNTDDICGVHSTPAVPVRFLDQPQLDEIVSSLQRVTPRGGTPIIGATVLGFRHLHQQAPLPIPSNSFLVVLTDGADTCDPGEGGRLVTDEIPKALSVGIRTFAIGVPGSENGRALLSSMAWAGGTARAEGCDHSASARDAGDCHFDMASSQDLAADLSDALAQIGGKTITCQFDLPESTDGAPVDPQLVNVDYYPGGGGELVSIPKDDSAACGAGADGWQYAENGSRIELCGAACDSVKSDPSARVEIVLGCESVVR